MSQEIQLALSLTVAFKPRRLAEVVYLLEDGSSICRIVPHVEPGSGRPGILARLESVIPFDTLEDCARARYQAALENSPWDAPRAFRRSDVRSISIHLSDGVKRNVRLCEVWFEVANGQMVRGYPGAGDQSMTLEAFSDGQYYGPPWGANFDWVEALQPFLEELYLWGLATGVGQNDATAVPQLISPRKWFGNLKF
ncbi:hypothetical protein PQR75_00835 [Paraburkholderia fungorum]|uniref:hypothetical protein n=1 Tax=Paraburkholderia fungorum TaxID=134537 RepID=UPI0038BB988E